MRRGSLDAQLLQLALQLGNLLILLTQALGSFPAGGLLP